MGLNSEHDAKNATFVYIGNSVLCEQVGFLVENKCCLKRFIGKAFGNTLFFQNV